ncbi:hypothetical protein KCU78_g6868, partial [Aureobasidium melanogenum]
MSRKSTLPLLNEDHHLRILPVVSNPITSNDQPAPPTADRPEPVPYPVQPESKLFFVDFDENGFLESTMREAPRTQSAQRI